MKIWPKIIKIISDYGKDQDECKKNAVIAKTKTKTKKQPCREDC